MDCRVKPGKFVQVELMLKDAQRYKETQGWGWGRWRGLDLKPYGSDSNFVNECTGCHEPLRGNDYVYPGGTGGHLSNFKNELTGCGPFLHDDPRDRPPDIFGGTTSLHFGGTAQPYLLLPIIPPKKIAAKEKNEKTKK